MKYDDELFLLLLTVFVIRRSVAFGIAFLALAQMDGFAVMALVLVASTYLPRT